MIYKDVLKIIGKRVDAAPTQHEGLATAHQPYHIVGGLQSLSRQAGEHHATDAEGCYNQPCLGENKLPLRTNICTYYNKEHVFRGC